MKESNIDFLAELGQTASEIAEAAAEARREIDRLTDLVDKLTKIRDSIDSVEQRAYSISGACIGRIAQEFADSKDPEKKT